MEEKVNSIEQKLDRIEKALDKITFYVYSDPNTDSKGLVEKLNILEKILEDVITREKIYKAKATVWGMVGAAIVSIGWKVITMIYK